MTDDFAPYWVTLTERVMLHWQTYRVYPLDDGAYYRLSWVEKESLQANAWKSMEIPND